MIFIILGILLLCYPYEVADKAYRKKHVDRHNAEYKKWKEDFDAKWEKEHLKRPSSLSTFCLFSL